MFFSISSCTEKQSIIINTAFNGNRISRNHNIIPYILSINNFRDCRFLFLF